MSIGGESVFPNIFDVNFYSGILQIECLAWLTVINWFGSRLWWHCYSIALSNITCSMVYSDLPTLIHVPLGSYNKTCKKFNKNVLKIYQLLFGDWLNWRKKRNTNYVNPTPILENFFDVANINLVRGIWGFSPRFLGFFINWH